MLSSLLNTKARSSSKKTELFNIFLPSISQTLACSVTYSIKRKSLKLVVEQNVLSVTSPNWLNQAQIQSFILSKQLWIEKQLSKQHSYVKNRMLYQDGDQFLLLGEWWTLSLSSGLKFDSQADETNKTLTFIIPNTVVHKSQYIKKKLTDFYTKKAQSIVVEMLAIQQQNTGLQNSSLDFKVYKRRWGCCYSSGKIIINPMIVAAPMWVINCVLIHELCHLVHMDHSKSFWQLNDKFCGNCKASNEWLTTHQQAITLLNCQ